MTTRRTKAQAWLKFEMAVAKLYAELGAIGVEQDKDIAGNQIDVFALVPLIDGTFSRHIISCKCYNRAAGVADVREWHEVFLACSRANEADAAVLVSQFNFSRPAKTLAERTGIRLRTFEQLKWANIDLSPYLKDMLSEFKDEPTFKHHRYIPVRVIEEGGSIESAADDVLTTFLSRTEPRLLTVLGDYGSGKTTFCKHVFQLLAARALDGDESAHLPVYLNLRDYPGQLNMRGFILDVLINQHNGRCQNYAQFKRLLDAGHVLLILDAFDEMATRVSRQETIQNFEAVHSLLVGKAKALLTCRTHFFKSPDEVHELHEGTELYQISQKHNYGIVHVQPFNESEIETYVQTACGKSAREALEVIKRTYDLMGLAKRPILLDMITEVVPTLVDSKESINNATLYNRYVTQWLKRDDWRVQLDRKLRREFTIAFAMEMYVQGKTSFTWEEVVDAVQQHFRLADPHFLRQYENDIRICSFIRRIGDSFRFVHKSFVEYFVSVRLYQDIVNDDNTRFLHHRYSPEVLTFLSQHLGTAELRRNIRRWLSEAKDYEDLVANTFALLGYWDNRLTGDFSEVRFSKQTLVDRQVTDCKFDKVDVQDVAWRHANWSNVQSTSSKWKGCHWSRTNWREVTFHNDNLSESEVDGNLSGVKWTHCKLQGVELNMPQSNAVSFEHTELENCGLVGTGRGFRFVQCTIKDGSIELPLVEATGTKFIGSTIVNCDLAGAELRGARFERAKLKEVRLSFKSLRGVTFTDTAFEKLQLLPDGDGQIQDKSRRWRKDQAPTFEYVTGVPKQLRERLEELGALFVDPEKPTSKKKTKKMSR